MHRDGPGRDDRDTVAEHCHLLHDVAREQHAAARIAPLPDDLAQHPGRHHVQTVGGFVEDQGVRVVDQGTGQRDADALALGEPLGTPVGKRLDAEANHHPIHRRLEPSACETLKRREIGDVLPRREIGVQVRVVRQYADPPAHRNRVRPNVDPAHTRRPAIGRENGAQDPQRGGLARAVRTQKARDLAIRGREADALQRLDLAEALGEVLHLDHGGGPMRDVNNGNGLMRSTHSRSSEPGSAVSTNSAIRRGTQPTISIP